MKRLLFAFLTVAILFSMGCAGEVKETDVEVTLRVTQNFGEKELVSLTTTLNKERHVAQLLEDATRTEFAYGGSFVESIEGLKSKKRTLNSPANDWFYYVNGVLSDVGARDYELQAGDQVLWDYHPWRGNTLNSAVIGQYPEPFLHGFRGNSGALILYASADGSRIQAEKVAKSLKKAGVQKVLVQPYSDQTLQKKELPCIIIGTWSELANSQILSEMNENSKKIGSHVIFSKEGVQLLDPFGKQTVTLTSESGVLVATGSGMGDQAPIWLMIGTDQVGLSKIGNIMVENEESLKGHYGLAISADKIISLPVWSAPKGVK